MIYIRIMIEISSQILKSIFNSFMKWQRANVCKKTMLYDKRPKINGKFQKFDTLLFVGDSNINVGKKLRFDENVFRYEV